MKEFFTKLKKGVFSETAALGSLIVALVYDVYYLDLMDPLKFSLSEIGRHNIPLFIAWCVLSGTAIYLNVVRFYSRINYKGKLGWILLYSGLFFLVLTFCNMSRVPVFYWIHVSTAILFSVLDFASIALGLVYMFKKSKLYRVVSIIFFSLIFADIVMLAVFKQMALYEFIPLILGFIVMFFTNFTKTFEVSPTE
jgi:hypothetical protein